MGSDCERIIASLISRKILSKICFALVGLKAGTKVGGSKKGVNNLVQRLGGNKLSIFFSPSSTSDLFSSSRRVLDPSSKRAVPFLVTPFFSTGFFFLGFFLFFFFFPFFVIISSSSSSD